MTHSPPYLLSDREEKQAIEDAKLSEYRRLKEKLKNKGLVVPLEEITVDEKAVLERANNIKYGDFLRAERRRRELEEKQKQYQILKSEWTAERMFKHIREESFINHGRNFDYVEGENKHGVKALCYFIAQDPRFETEMGYSLDKGIYLRGTYGVGKTHLIRCLSTNLLHPILMTSIQNIKKIVQKHGTFDLTLDRFTYIDDLGTEKLPMMFYKAEINWFKDFIEDAYFEGKALNRLIFTSNLNIKGLMEKYGERVVDRLAEKFNTIEISGQSKRIGK